MNKYKNTLKLKKTNYQKILKKYFFNKYKNTYFKLKIY